MRPGREVQATEMTLSVEPPFVRPVTLEHGEDLVGRNIIEVAKTALCQRPCRWCDALVKRCQSRGGRTT